MVNDDRAEEMVAPEEEERDAAGESTDGDEQTPTSTTAAQDDRLSPASLYCSLPLNRDVQSIIDIFPKADTERKKTRKLPCLYCERTFVADGLRQKHVERCHSMKQARRSSSRFQQAGITAPGNAGPTTVSAPLQCMYCNAFQSSDGDLGDLFSHLLYEHSDRYHACELCKERFVLKTHLEEHRDEVHGALKLERDIDVESVINAHVIEQVFKSAKPVAKVKDAKELKESRDFKDSKNFKESKDTDEVITLEPKELRSTPKRSAIKSTKLGIKRSARLQNKELPSQNKSASASSQKKKSAKSKSQEVDLPIEREIVKVPVHENPYPTFDAFYRVKKITDHSIDNLRITSLTFNDVFDQAFYTRIKCNIADNLMNHIDGKLFKNEESESRISNFEKAQVEMTQQGESNYGCEISLNAATPVASFLAPQLGDDPEAQIEYGSKASKKKTKTDEVHYKYFTRRKYQASIQEIKENRDLSKLDMWTQYGVKNRQQAVANKNKSEKEKQDYKKGEEYRAKRQNEELNRILDRRGPFEDLKLEANKQAVLEGNSSREARVEVSSILEDILYKVFDVSMQNSEIHSKGIKTELTDTEIPEYLNLRRASFTDETYVDRSDKITLICASEETENFEAPQISPRDKHSLVELTGEWTRSRLFICAACGMKLGNMKSLIDHKNNIHQNVWCHHYEFVGKQGAYYKHLSIPGLGKMQHLEEYPMSKAWLRSNARQCTKCKKFCNSLGELHRHILECGEDWSWMLIRKKCKYRPFGAKTRRKRRGLIKRQIINKEKDHKEKKTYKKEERPRVKPSDAETIQRMLANLPAKRATRKDGSLKDGFPKLNSKKNDKKDSKFTATKSRAEQLIQESTVVKRKVMVANKCNPIGNIRKSVRNVNKVISSALIDNNIRMRRKFKNAMQTRIILPAPDKELTVVEAPAELTEEQRAEEVKKKISLFKKVQNLRRSVIKKRTTKISTSSADTEAEPSTSGTNRKDSADLVRKTRSAVSFRTENLVKSPPKKKLRSNFGARLIRTLSLRRRNKDRSNQQSKDGESAASAPKRKLSFANIKKAVKKLKVSNKTADSDIKIVQVEEPPKPVNGTDADIENALPPPPLSPMDGHFLEESIRAKAIRTISEQSDNDNRPSAIAPPSDNTNISVTVTVHQKANSDKDNNETNDFAVNLPNDPKSPTAIVTPFNKTIEQIAAVDEILRSSSPCVPLNLVINSKTNASDCVTASKIAPSNFATPIFAAQLTTTEDDSNKLMQLANDELGIATAEASDSQKVDIYQKPKNKLCKRAKGLNDCIAMLTSKLKCKSDPEPFLKIIPSLNDSAQQVQKHLESAVVVVTPHDTTTEEQNVVIPEETDSVNLESAKEPEVAPPSPKNGNKLETMQTSISDIQTATVLTISDLSRPVIEQDKENIELEQKSLLPQSKQGFDTSLEKVVDIFKCFDDMKSKEIRNGHLDSITILNHAQTEVINDLTKSANQGRKIGASRKPTSQRAKLVQESLTHARLEKERYHFIKGTERKMGSRRSLPPRNSKRARIVENPKEEHSNVAICGPEVKIDISMCNDTMSRNDENSREKNDTNTNFILQIPKFNLSTIAEENTLLDKSVLLAENSTTDESQVIDHPNNAPQPPVIVQTIDVASQPTENADIIKVDDHHEVGFRHLQPQNEADVLENKAIPLSDVLSESEDELPLAALIKTITPLSFETNPNSSDDSLQTDGQISKDVTSESVTVHKTLECMKHVPTSKGAYTIPDSVDRGIMESADMGVSLKDIPISENLQSEYAKQAPIIQKLGLDEDKEISSMTKMVSEKAKAPAKNNKRLGKMEVKRLHTYFNPIVIPIDKSWDTKSKIAAENVINDNDTELQSSDKITAVNELIPTVEEDSIDTTLLASNVEFMRSGISTIILEKQQPVESVSSQEINTAIIAEGDKFSPEVDKHTDIIEILQLSEPKKLDETETGNPEMHSTVMETANTASEFIVTKNRSGFIVARNPSEDVSSNIITEIETPPEIILAAISQLMSTTPKSKKSKKSRKFKKSRMELLENPDDVISLELTQKWNEQLRAITTRNRKSPERNSVTELMAAERNLPEMCISQSDTVNSNVTSQRIQIPAIAFVPTPESQPLISKEFNIENDACKTVENREIIKSDIFCKSTGVEEILLSNIVVKDCKTLDLGNQKPQNSIAVTDNNSDEISIITEDISISKVAFSHLVEKPLPSKRIEELTLNYESALKTEPLIRKENIGNSLEGNELTITLDIASSKEANKEEPSLPTIGKLVTEDSDDLESVINNTPQLRLEKIACGESPEIGPKTNADSSEMIHESDGTDKSLNRQNTVTPINQLPEENVDDILEEDVPLKCLIKAVPPNKTRKLKKSKKLNAILADSIISTSQNFFPVVQEEDLPVANFINKNTECSGIVVDKSPIVELVHETPKSRRCKKVKSKLETIVIDKELIDNSDHSAVISVNSRPKRSTREKEVLRVLNTKTCDDDITITSSIVADEDSVSKIIEANCEENQFSAKLDINDSPTPIVTKSKRGRKRKDNSIKNAKEVSKVDVIPNKNIPEVPLVSTVGAEITEKHEEFQKTADDVKIATVEVSFDKVEIEVPNPIIETQDSRTRRTRKQKESVIDDEPAIEDKKLSIEIETYAEPKKSKRGRKRKSTEPLVVPCTEIVIDKIVPDIPSKMIEAPETPQNESKKLIPLSIYDFDEDDDECTGDNSKENMTHVRSKSPNRHKRSLTKSISDNKLCDVPKETPQLEEINTPLKDVQNESFIQTPDMNDSGLANKLAGRFKIKKGKTKSKKQNVPEELLAEHYCDICNKQFGRLDSLNKHKRTLTHIAKLSEIEALEAEAKKKQRELEESQQSTVESKEVEDELSVDDENLTEVSNEVDERKSTASVQDVDLNTEDVETIAPITEPEIYDSVNLESDDEGSIRSLSSPFIPAKTQNSPSIPSEVTNSVLVTSPFSLNTNNDSLRLADIISDVLNKPVENMESYDLDKTEPKRYKSLGERKSFDSDSVTCNPTSSFTNISPASTLINKNTSDEFLKNQLSLLENIIEENKASFEYMDDGSVQSIDSIKSDRCPSDMSLVSDIQPDDSSRIISYTQNNHLHDEENFVKPSHQTQYEEISEDSMNNRNYELERSRKTLNRDEELFLECCSLLKSSSEVSNYSKKSSRAPPLRTNDGNLNKCDANEGWLREEYKTTRNKKVCDEDDFMSDSDLNTPIGDTYDDFSNSDTIKTDWSTKMNEKTRYEDISQSSVEKCNGEERNTFKGFNFKTLISKSEIEESSDSTDFKKNINAKFVGLMAEALKGKSPKRKKHKERESKKKTTTDTTQTSITDYTVQLTPKSSVDSTDNFLDLTNDSKKMLTKGAMKVFEGLKVSIPTDDLDMNQVFNCSPKAKRLEIEESIKINGRAKNVNAFGNKLGLKVTKKRTQKQRKKVSEDFIVDSDKVLDVYDFEETQDNTDLFSPSSKVAFRNGKKNAEKIESTKKAKIVEDVLESESESINHDLDLFNAEVQSVNSFSTETQSSTSIKPVNVDTTNESITKKKCVIMGRIFKNAFKAKTEGSKENTPIDETDPLDRFIIGGPLEEIATPPPEKSPISIERPKMTEKEMDLLFDRLLQTEHPKVDGKPGTVFNDDTPLVSPIAKNEEQKEFKDSKSKKHTPKAVKPNRRRSRKHSESSDDEFNLTKSPKKRQARKSNKEKDNGINLEQELKECMGVAGRKSQRKCTSGKQNVFIEYWSSDDSEFEAMLRLSMQETVPSRKEKSKELPANHLNDPEEETENNDLDEIETGKYENDEELPDLESSLPPSKTLDEKFEDENKSVMKSDDVFELKPAGKTKAKRSSSSSKSENKSPKTPKSAKHARLSKSSQDDETLAANRRKRAAVDTLYYWSSSSDDDTQNLIEVKSLRDEIDDEEDRPQHGWIVGDSPKKLVTLLAHAKGKKTSNR